MRTVPRHPFAGSPFKAGPVAPVMDDRSPTNCDLASPVRPFGSYSFVELPMGLTADPSASSLFHTARRLGRGTAGNARIQSPRFEHVQPATRYALLSMTPA